MKVKDIKKKSINSHVNKSTGIPKIEYETPGSARKAIINMKKKHPHSHFTFYKCLYCGNYHIANF